MNERIGKLDWKLGDTVNLKAKQGDISWPRNYAALLEYYKEHGTCNVPQKTVYECDLLGLGENGGVYHYVGKLGNWLKYQRKAKKGKDNKKITPDRQAMLQTLVDEGKCMCVFHFIMRRSYIGIPIITTIFVLLLFVFCA